MGFLSGFWLVPLVPALLCVSFLSSVTVKPYRWPVPDRTLLRGKEKKKRRCIQNTFRLGTIQSRAELSRAGLGFNWLRVQLGLSAASGRSYASSQNSHFTPQLLGRSFYNRQILFTALSRGGADKMSKMRGRRDGELSSAGRFIFHVATQLSRRELEK